MLRRDLLAALMVPAVLPAQMKMSVRQIEAFIRSSIRLNHDDGKVAGYLKRVKLSERLEDRVIETLQGEGAGPKTVEALRLLRDASKSLAAAVVEAPAAPPPPIPPPSEEEQRALIEQTRQYALSYTKSLPDFICTQVTRRYADPSGLEFWQQQDIITTKLSFVDNKEDYQVILVNNHPAQVDYQKLGGAISAGEFGTMMKEVFEPSSGATFEWQRWARLHGRRMHVLGYRVPQPKSKWTISYQNTQQITTGYQGLVYVDAQDNTVARLKLEAENIPPSFPVREASVVLDYDMVPIGSGQYMLPLKHTMRMREAKFLVKNEVEFRMYRKFGAETNIIFDTPDALPDERLIEQPPQ